MGMMDNMGNKMDDEMRDKFEELKSKEQAGQLDDRGREELAQLRDRFEHKNN